MDDREYLEQMRRSVLTLLAAFLRYTPTSRYTLDVRIVERQHPAQR